MSKTLKNESLLPPRWIITLGVVLLFFWLLSALKEIVVMLVLAYCLAYLIAPVVDLLERRKIPRSLGCLLVFVGAALICLALLLTALPTIAREYQKFAENFPQYLQTAKERVLPLLDSLKAYMPLPANGEELLAFAFDKIPQVDRESVGRVLSTLGATLLQGYSLTLTLLNFVLLPFITFYLVVDFPVFHKWCLELFAPATRKKALALAREIDSYVSAFVRGQCTVGCILFVLYAIGLWAIGVELWILLAIISGFGAIIPYMGFLVGIVLSLVMALVTFGDLSHVLQVVGLFLIIQFIEGWVITPKIVGEKVGLSPIIVILAILAAGHLFGLLGVFLAVPGAAVLRVLLRHAHQWVIRSASA
jgi:predicted PurR-regulated permease PerM